MAKKKYSKKWLLELYKKMVLIREFEEQVKRLFLEGKMPGTIHQYHGQEACAVGVCAAMQEKDVLTSTHRPHGHSIAKGVDVQEMMDELFGKSTGCCHGKGGSMHIGDMAKGVLPAIAIVGGNVPIATGMALAFKMKKEKNVAVCFMGDGATNEGAFHEGVIMGAIWDLPVVYVVENNLYGASTSIGSVMKTKNISDRACAYGIPGETVDGNDVLAVYEAAKKAVKRARDGKGPTLLELITYRITGHSRRDPCAYQPEEERKKAKEKEPVINFGKHLIKEKITEQETLDDIVKSTRKQMSEMSEISMKAPDPAPEDTLKDVFFES
ncbi:MAG: thiamine pyrophosphate-dependent dehydrogenase E1 component subunit alpha [Prolixibacteraceae bacterium]